MKPRFLNSRILLMRLKMAGVLTVAGVATGMFLYVFVETMQSSLRIAKEAKALAQPRQR